MMVDDEVIDANARFEDNMGGRAKKFNGYCCLILHAHLLIIALDEDVNAIIAAVVLSLIIIMLLLIKS